jgi:hypothetical protein
MPFLSGKSARIRFARWFGDSKFDSHWIERRVIGVWSIVRIPAVTLADGKVKKHSLEYGLSKVFARPSGISGCSESGTAVGAGAGKAGAPGASRNRDVLGAMDAARPARLY